MIPTPPATSATIAPINGASTLPRIPPFSCSDAVVAEAWPLPVANTVVLEVVDEDGPDAEMVDPVSDARLVAAAGVGKAAEMDETSEFAWTVLLAVTVTVVVSVVRVLVTTLARMLME